VVPVYQWAIKPHAKGSASKVRVNFGNKCKKLFPQKSAMNVGRSNCQRQVSCDSSPHYRDKELKDAAGDFGD
jgi:hypothetical protein